MDQYNFVTAIFVVARVNVAKDQQLLTQFYGNAPLLIQFRILLISVADNVPPQGILPPPGCADPKHADMDEMPGRLPCVPLTLWKR